MFLVPLLLLDATYFYVTRSFSTDVIRQIQGSVKTPLRIVSILFTYACISALLYVFILQPKRSVGEAFLLGFCVYGIYEGTNRVIFKNWPVTFAVMDTLWGGILFALTTWVSRLKI
jgi:uncharacterized membrane protein